HDADKHDQADEGVDIQLEAENHQGQQRTKTGGRQAGQDRDGMNETFVKDSENDVNDQNGDDEQRAQAFYGGLIDLRRTLEARGDAGRQMHFILDAIDLFHGGAEGMAGREVEGKGDAG